MLNAKMSAFLLAWFIAIGCIFTGLSTFPLIDPDEGRNAEIAREMKDAHSYLIPLYNGLPRLDKPALYFDSLALSFSLFGENEVAARLPSAIFGLFTLILVCLFCWKVYDLSVAALAVLVLGTSPLFILFSHITILDMQLAFFVSASLFCGYLTLNNLEKSKPESAKNWSLLTIIAAALATLIKGPVGFILPLLGLAAYARAYKIEGGRCFFSRLNNLVFFGLISLWFFSLTWFRPDFAYYGLFKETFGRFFSAGEVHRSGSIFYYIPVLLAVFFPWSLLLTEMTIRGWKNRKNAVSADPLLAIFALIVLVFFSISKSKLPGYILPAVIALAILVARTFGTAIKTPDSAIRQSIQRSLMLLIVLTGLLSSLFMLNYFEALDFQSLFNLPDKAVKQLQFLSLPFMFGLPIVFLTAVAARLSGHVLAMLMVFALTPLLLFSVAKTEGLKDYTEQLSSRELAQKISQLLPEGGKVVCYKCMPTGLPFYLRKNIVVISADGSELTGNYIKFYLQQNPQWPAQIVPFKEALKWFASEKKPLFLLVHHQYKPGKIFAAMVGTKLERLTDRWLGGLVSDNRTAQSSLKLSESLALASEN